ncbi:MAG: leucine-rich repeat protein [Lachnospiraceae bacterium]|nr:leucine-rich repeat protein [Lachnospiraceae bacterium]
MVKIKILAGVFLLAAFLAVTGPLMAQAESQWYEYGDCKVQFDPATGTLEWFDDGALTDVSKVIVPETIDGVTVRYIGDMAFANNYKVKNVTIPGTVVSIGRYAFINCDALAGVDIASSVKTIGEGAFKNCTALKKVTLRAGKINLENEAFSGCSGLTKFTAKGKLSIGDKAFFRCYKLATVQAKKGITFIGDMAFYECFKLLKLTTVKTLDYLGDEAFFGCTRFKGESKLEAAVVNKLTAEINFSSKKVSYSKLKKADRTVSITVSGSRGTVKYTNKSSSKLKKYVSIDRDGTVTIKKGAPKGTYKIKVTVSAKGMYKKTSKTIKIKVK